MTSKQLRGYLKAWIKQVLVTEQGSSIKVITSYQNAPQPGVPYITIPYMPGRGSFGMASKGETQADGTRVNVSDNQLTIELRETFGEGDYLNELIKSLERDDILNDYFRAYGLAYYNHGEISPVPRLDQDDWIREAMVEINLGVAESTDETTSYIETVEYESNIGGEDE